MPQMNQQDVTDNAKLKSQQQPQQQQTNSNNSSINSNKPPIVKETTFEQEILQKQKQLQPIKHINRPPPITDPRTDLLAAIREGIKLRRVENSKQKETVEKAENLSDVASIFQRRLATQYSEPESNDSDNSDDEWDDESDL